MHQHTSIQILQVRVDTQSIMKTFYCNTRSNIYNSKLFYLGVSLSITEATRKQTIELSPRVFLKMFCTSSGERLLRRDSWSIIGPSKLCVLNLLKQR